VKRRTGDAVLLSVIEIPWTIARRLKTEKDQQLAV
jgi:hypothetical protein